MKKYLFFCLIILITISLSNDLLAQTTGMLKEEWQKEMQVATAKRDSLKRVVESLEGRLAELRTQDQQRTDLLASLKKQLEDAVGDLRAYNAKLDAIENRLNEMSRLSNQDLWARKAELDSIQKMIDAARMEKASRLAANKQRLDNMQQRLNALKQTVANMTPPEQTYTVGTWKRDRDCLWNIAKKPAIYDNPFLWPKIWAGNRDQIKNPDIIHPGQVLKIPAKADLNQEEKKMVNNYWARKRSAAQPTQPTR